MIDPRINQAPEGAARELPKGFMEFYLPLHREFTPRQQALAAHRKEVLAAAHAGRRPDHLPPSVATKGDWRIKIPEWCLDQRNQMTGPADEAELVVKMLNSGAPGVMVDLEDSMANQWGNLQVGVPNILAALRGELTYYDKKRDRTVGIEPSRTVLFSRVRGLHLSQAGLLPGDELTSASLFDTALIAYQVDASTLKHNLSFYIPKSEAAEEATWWSDVFKAISRFKGWSADYIKCMALVESHPLAYRMEEFLHNLKDHILGLNLGRWDYMASLIHYNLEDADWVLPDRNTIPFDVAFFQRLRYLLAEITHRRGALAIGGMTALYPSREDPELNARALAVLERDKRNESDCSMDGAWTGHPDQNAIAVAQFPVPNQIHRKPASTDRYPDLRPAPEGVGKRTLDGTRAAIRTVIRYRNGVVNGKGASLLDGYMEDLATDRIYRLMIAQRMKHWKEVPILDADGSVVPHTPEAITRLFDEELIRLVDELSRLKDLGTPDTLAEGRQKGEEMIRNAWFDPI